MATKYSNDELAERVRSANRRRSITRREKLATAEKSALTVWVPVDLRQRFIAAAQARQATISELATELLAAGLSAVQDGKAPGTKTTPFLPVSVSEDPTGAEGGTALMAEVGKLLEEGLSGADIAQRFNTEGRRTKRGVAFVGNNLLRDYRKYQTTNQ